MEYQSFNKKNKIEQLSIEVLTNQEQKAVDAFKKTLKRREEGKPDGDGWEGDEQPIFRD